MGITRYSDGWRRVREKWTCIKASERQMTNYYWPTPSFVQILVSSCAGMDDNHLLSLFDGMSDIALSLSLSLSFSLILSLSLSLSLSLCRPYMAKILPIRRKTQSNQSINQSITLYFILYMRVKTGNLLYSIQSINICWLLFKMNIGKMNRSVNIHRRGR